jgi:hypothetical protein
MNDYAEKMKKIIGELEKAIDKLITIPTPKKEVVFEVWDHIIDVLFRLKEY